jgi:hypothetical protein
MEWTTMNEDNAYESLLVLIGELLYKNQLLREAMASKDEVIELIINNLRIVAASACSCGVANQLKFVRSTVKERDVEVSWPEKRHCFNESCNIVKHPIDSPQIPLGSDDQCCRKIEVDAYNFRGFGQRCKP